MTKENNFLTLQKLIFVLQLKVYIKSFSNRILQIDYGSIFSLKSCSKTLSLG